MDRAEIESALPPGYVLVAPETANKLQKLHLRCPNGHDWLTARIWRIEIGIRCSVCRRANGPANSLKTEEIRSRLISYGWELLGEYRGMSMKSRIRCLDCKEERESIVYNIKQSCINCQRRKETHRALEEIKTILANRGAVLIDYDKNVPIKRARCTVQCSNGHVQKLAMRSLTNARDCGYCHGNKRLTLDTVRLRLDPGYLVEGEYLGEQAPLRFTCPVGHNFVASWNSYQRGHRCPECFGRVRLEVSEVRERVNKLYLQWVSGEYENIDSPLTLWCGRQEHPQFQRSVRKLHWEPVACPKCQEAMRSMEEIRIYEWLTGLGFKCIQQDRDTLDGGLEIDIFIPDKRVGIEYCGHYYHSENFKNKDYHYLKKTLADKAGIKLLTVFEGEWINKQEIVKSLILSKLGRYEKTVYARACNIEMLKPATMRKFMNENHLQGPPGFGTKLGWGLVHEGEILMAVSIGKPHRQNIEHQMVIDRVCSKANHRVIGGFSRLMGQVLEYCRNTGVSEIITYSDNRYSTGRLYGESGWSPQGDIPISYYYVKGTRIKSKQSMKIKEHEKGIGLTEKELRKADGWMRIFDCGKKMFSYSVKNALVEEKAPEEGAQFPKR